MSILANAWFEECKRLEMNQAILLRVANKDEQKKLVRELESERTAFTQIDLVHASQLFIKGVLKDAKQYVMIERKFRTPLTAFFKDENEIMSKISIDPERHRIIRLMIQDGKPRSEVEDTLNGLTDDEIERFYP